MRKVLIGAALAAALPFASVFAEQRIVEVGYWSAVSIENAQAWRWPSDTDCSLSYFEYASRDKTAKFAVTCARRKQVYVLQTGDWVKSVFAQECWRGDCQSLIINIRLDELKDNGSAVINLYAGVIQSRNPAS